MVKKTPVAKKKTTTAKTPAKKTAAKGKAAPVKHGPNREVNKETGYAVGSDQDTIALALLAGGESRAAISETLAKKLNATTRNGTPKQIPNMVSGVYNKMVKDGYRVESTLRLLPPTPASKRKATAARNAAAAATATKTTAAKPAAKKAAAKTTTKKTTTKKRAAKK